ncbi:hypothetical protein [Candidatus Spongiisocius sp.]|uniref:hypothetical protein n=1 Tax=Candidatus Spongiisocius sp. TaxID=3101273 RepID=UPI003B593A38
MAVPHFRQNRIGEELAAALTPDKVAQLDAGLGEVVDLYVGVPVARSMNLRLGREAG